MRFSDEEKARRIKAEVHLLGRLSRCAADELKCACPLCDGDMSMHVTRRDARGHIEQTRGACGTPDCLVWNQ